VLRISLPTGERRERSERTGDSCPDHGGLRPHGEHVGPDRSERRDLCRTPRHAERERKPERPEHDHGHVPTAHRQQVVEAARTEALPERVGEPLVLAEEYPLQNGAALPREPWHPVAREPCMETIRDSAEAATTADDAPAIRAQDSVNPVPAEPGLLVEAVRRPTWFSELAEKREACALRRRPSERQLEQHVLVRTERSPANDESPHPQLEAAVTRRLLDVDQRALGRADQRREPAAVDLGETKAPPSPAAERKGRRNSREPETVISGNRFEDEQRSACACGRNGGDSHRRRGREPDTEGAREQVRQAEAHGITSPFS